MQIYVGKNGQQLGPFSLEEVNRKLADGTFAGTDLAWYEGAAGWAPLSRLARVAIPGGILIVPLCFLAQFLSLMVFGGTVERKELSDIKSNLILIDSAKTKWSAETKATDGTPVTMASLQSHLGKEVKPVVDETYDPMPVGQPPTATLPANKTLGTFGGGDVMTVVTIDTALANTSAFSWNLKKSTTTTTSPTPRSISPKSKPSIAPSVAPSTTPSETASPKPSISPRSSPRSSATPHSLISPRQREENEEPPSSRPSPSAKFAPPHKRSDTNPRQSPTENEPADGLRHGKQQPSESSSPSPSPDDDD